MLTQWSKIWLRIIAILEAFSPITFTRQRAGDRCLMPLSSWISCPQLPISHSQYAWCLVLSSKIKVIFILDFLSRLYCAIGVWMTIRSLRKTGEDQSYDLHAKNACNKRTDKPKLFQAIFKHFCFKVCRSFCLKIIWSLDKEWKRKESIWKNFSVLFK